MLLLFLISPLIHAQFGMDGMDGSFGPFGMRHHHHHGFGGPFGRGPMGGPMGPMGPMRGPMGPMRGPSGPMGPMRAGMGMGGGPMGPMGGMGGGPPMRRPPWMFRPPPPPFFRRGPRPFMGDGPPMSDFGDEPMGPMRPMIEQPMPPPQQPMIPPPQPPPVQPMPQMPQMPMMRPQAPPPPPPAPMMPAPAPRFPAPQFDRLTASLRGLINNVNYYNTAFRGQSYENVINALHRYYGQRAGITFNPQTTVNTGALHNEVRANSRVANGLFEADMMLTMNQLNQIIGGRRWKRKVTSEMSKRWATSISYKFNDNDANWRSLIRTAIRLYETHTCVRFVENGGAIDSIVFTRGEGCFSGVGKLGGQQEISLGSGCETVGIASHEIGHTLGMYHEQSRPERDGYIRVNYQNIISGYQGMFDKRSPSLSISMGIPYDYGSVMHYAVNAFSKNFGTDTITPLRSQYSATIGNRVEPSFYDYKAVNLLYCSTRCGPPLPCQNEGYTNPNTCNTCVCPTGLGGTYCDQVAYSTCGRDLVADSNFRTLTYYGSGTCYWRIKSPNQGRIRLQISKIGYACAVSCEQFVEIKSGLSLAATGARMCCQPTMTQMLSDSSTVILISRATQSSQFVIQYRNEGGVAQQRAPARQPVPVTFGRWSGWSGWSRCTEQCGACGTRQRKRSCLSGRCSGSSLESQICNFNACRRGTTFYRRGKRSALLEYFEDEVTRVKRNTEWWCCERYLARGSVCVHV
ncbi:unnamed protein product, partial [Mesorhabditis belari]|uniref:Metalloendopeptidase n=1 Tax=Mesorhabditis belari TaxID=2138241 RepID=A0AAF3EHA6_9BILA